MVVENLSVSPMLKKLHDERILWVYEEGGCLFIEECGRHRFSAEVTADDLRQLADDIRAIADEQDAACRHQELADS